jgi:phage repressor protein C with HTH and peptisase S24 domain
MLTHKQVWDGIDQLARKHGLSASALAKRAGLDPTTFNKSKRTTKQGKPRWPSTESLSKVLDATGTGMREFVELMQESGGGMAVSGQRLKCMRMGQIESSGGLDASGFPAAGAWEDIEYPMIEDPQAYVVEVDRELAPPAYRSGDLLVVSPSSSIRRNDRVLVRYKDGHLLLGTLIRRTAQRVVLESVEKTEGELSIDSNDLAWLARIVWMSQ